MREDNAETNRRIDHVRDTLLAAIAENRKEIRGIYRLLLGGFVPTLFVPIVAGAVAVVVKLFFGV